MITFRGRPAPAGFNASAFSGDPPIHNSLGKFLVTRKLYWRVHTKPVVYWESIVEGRISLPRVSPCVVSVASDQPAPPETSQPLLNSGSVHNCRWRNT